VGAAKFARAVESATAGSLDAVFNTGLFHEHGTGTDVSPSDALACFRRAADGGHALAQNKLGYVYEHGSLGVAADAAAAAAWYRRAADGGCSEGMYNFAVARQRGAGVQCDAADALRWFRRAAEAGVANAQFNVAVSLLSGGAGAEGSTDAAAEAVEWLTRDKDLVARTLLSEIVDRTRMVNASAAHAKALEEDFKAKATKFDQDLKSQTKRADDAESALESARLGDRAAGVTSRSPAAARAARPALHATANARIPRAMRAAFPASD
jgi:hypothetical protein